MAFNEVPKYRLLAPHFLEDECWRDAGTVIEYNGCPSEHMEPMNDAATRVMTGFLEELDNGAALKAEMQGRVARPRMKDLGDQVLEAVSERPREARQMPKYDDDVPMRPDMVSKSRRRNNRADLVVSAESPKRGPRDESKTIAIQGRHYTGDAASEAGI